MNKILGLKGSDMKLYLEVYTQHGHECHGSFAC